MRGSGTGPPGVGCIAGDCTLNIAWKGGPFNRIGLPFWLWTLRFVGARMICSEPVPGVTNGGAVYMSGDCNDIGSSSPCRQMSWPPICTLVLDPCNGTGATIWGTIAGGGTVIWI